MFALSTSQLNQLASLIGQLSDAHYTCPLAALSSASIGQHVRHVIELYQALQAGYASGLVNYDNRKRNAVFATDRQAAIGAIAQIIGQLAQPDKPLVLQSWASSEPSVFATHYMRELLYNFEHTIHHAALIRVGLKELEQETLVTENFGVAPATMFFKETQKTSC